ncbi:hypothetical protein [Salmonella phage PKM.Hi.22.6]|nr:hypothetical protein [Salmonella phage PKM.Hi.22.6]
MSSLADIWWIEYDLAAVAVVTIIAIEVHYEHKKRKYLEEDN